MKFRDLRNALSIGALGFVAWLVLKHKKHPRKALPAPAPQPEARDKAE